MNYEIELNIKDLDERLIESMIKIGKGHEFEVFYHGKDHLVFTSNRGNEFADLINCLGNICAYYGVDYVNLLDLD